MPRRLPLIALLALGGLAFLVSASTSTSSSQPTAESRDGLIAFGSTPSTPRNEDIYVMNPNRNRAETAHGSTRPRLRFRPGRPDGQKIAFTSRRNVDGKANTDIYVMEAADGSTVQRLTRSPAHQVVFRLVARRWAARLHELSRAERGHIPQDIYVMNADGSGQQSSRTSALPCTRRGRPTGADRLRQQLRHLDDQGGRNRTAEADAKRARTGWESDPAWSPDGSQIAFTSAGSNTPPLAST